MIKSYQFDGFLFVVLDKNSNKLVQILYLINLKSANINSNWFSF